MAKKIARQATPGITPIEMTEKISQVIDSVKNYFPYVKTIYVNAKGEYHFHPRKGFDAVNIDGSATPELPSAPNAVDGTIPTIPAGTENLEF